MTTEKSSTLNSSHSPSCGKKFCRRIFILILAGFIGCSRSEAPFEPMICYTPQTAQINALPTPFPPLEKEELQTLWGKELYLGTRFVEEGDWYRAITAFKSSFFLLPKREKARREQVEFYLFLSYYFAGKHKEALEVYESSTTLCLTDASFPARNELLLALWDSYTKCGRFEHADLIKCQMEPSLSEDLTVSEALQTGDIGTLNLFCERSEINALLWDYKESMKSPEKARLYQAILPGAGYAYVGQTKAAVTSFLINALFITAGVQFAKRGYYAASLITFSLETGWYFGGINGAGLAANEYNERLYESLGKETLMKAKYFPVLKFEFAF
jgi:tetratricopeptide (TPR) repeat protein